MITMCPCKDCEKKGCGDYPSQCKPYLEYVEYRKWLNIKERESKRFVYNITKRR